MVKRCHFIKISYTYDNYYIRIQRMKRYLLLKKDYPEEVGLKMNPVEILLEMRAEKVF